MQVSGIRVSTNNQISPVSAFDKLLFCFKINRRFSHLCLKYIIMTSLKCSLTSTCNIAHVLLNFSQVSLHPGWNIWAASFSVLLQFAQPVLSANKDEEICLSVGRRGRWRISQTRTQSAGCSSHAHKDSEKQQHFTLWSHHSMTTHLLGLLQIEQSNVSRLFVAGDDLLLPLGHAPVGRRRPGVLIG